MNGPYVRLGDVVDILSGFAFKSEQFNDTEGIPLIRIRDVVRGFSDTKYSGEYSKQFVVQDGEIVIGMDGNFNVARWKGGPALLNQRVCKVTARDNVLDDDYLFHFLPPVLQKIEDSTPFVTVKHLSAKDLREELIPLPPLPEQRRIAAILDQADALRAKRREALAQLDKLAQAIFVEMFGNVSASDWSIATIGDVAQAEGGIRTGPFGSQLLHSEFVDEGVAVLGIDNAVTNEFEWGERRFITEAKYRALKRYTVHPGDVLITIMGTCGRCAVVPDSIPLAINTKHLCCITLDPTKSLPEFVHSYFLRHPVAKRYLEQTAKGAIMAGLNMGIIKDMPIPLVPMPLQQEFVKKSAEIQRLKASLRQTSGGLDELFSSLQHRAFRGEL